MSVIPASALTKELLDSLLDFNPDEGTITWKYGIRWVKGGGNATVKNRDGRVVYIQARGYKVPRLMWTHVTGAIPEGMIYHIDGDKTNNRFDNLAEAKTLGKEVELTHGRLCDVLTYNPATGIFRWRAKLSSNINVGDVAGGIDGKGYGIIRLDDKYFRSHRLAWFYAYKAWPKNDIDHINGDILDNRIDNLRDVTKTVNMQNQRRPQKNNTSGFLGVSVNGKTGKFIPKIKVGAKNRSLKSFDTAEDAYAAYVAAKRELHEGCTI